MIVSLVAAMAENRVIGSKGKLPWNIPADLARFKSLTLGHTVVMGRRTFDSIGHPLPGRTNIVLSRTQEKIDGCVVARSIAEAIAAADGDREIFILGGAQVFLQALPLAHRIYLTLVHQTYDGDTFFPEIPEGFLEINREELAGATPPCTFTVFEKVEEIEPGADARELCAKGCAALKRELYYLARSCFQQAAELKPTPETYSYLALSLVKAGGELSEALRLAGEALEREPDNAVLYFNLGTVQVLAGRKEEALDTFRAGVRAGGGPEFLEELARHGPRTDPPFTSLARSHPLNRYLGMVLHRLRRR